MKSQLTEIDRFVNEDAGDLLSTHAEHRADPNQLIAQIATGDAVRADFSEVSEDLRRLASDIQALLDHPTAEVAQSVEAFFGAISDAESSRAQATSGEIHDVEFALRLGVPA